MYVHDEKKLCFLASPRTGSRSWRNSLTRLGFRRVGAHHTGPTDGFDTSDYFTFCVVRNHWDAILSWWFYRHGPKYERTPSLDWLARHVSVNSYMKAGELWHHAPFCDQIIKFSNMNQRYDDLMTEHFGEGNYPPLGHQGRSLARHSRPYWEYYNPETRNFIGWAWRDEIKRLGFEYHDPDFIGG